MLGTEPQIQLPANGSTVCFHVGDSYFYTINSSCNAEIGQHESYFG